MNTFAIYYGSRKTTTYENGKTLLVTATQRFVIVTEKSIVNNGILIQDSRLEKSPIKQNINPAPKNNPEKKSLFKRIYSDPWVIGISLIIIAAILGAERIKHWIDSYINGL